MENDQDILKFHDRTKNLKESVRKALKLIGQNPILMEPRYLSMVIAVFANDDPELVSQFNSHLKQSGRLTPHDAIDLDEFFWNWLKRNYAEQFESKEKDEHTGGTLQRLNEALREELEERFSKENKIKIQHAKDKIREELSKEFAVKVKEIMKSTGQTSESLDTMDAILEKGGKKALDLLSDHIENAKGSTNRIKVGAEDLQDRVKKLEEEVQYDTLAGLYTVRVFSQKFQTLVQQFNVDNATFSLAFLTVDKLDDYVSSSDPMISRKIFLGVVQQILDELHNFPSDIFPSRYDTNLMGVLFPAVRLEESMNFANRIRSMIEKHKFTTRDGKSIDLTVSAGVAEYSSKDNMWFDEILGGGKQLSSTIINRAMKLLKKAQSDGGNRVEKEIKETL